jgi:chemotaxis protein CheD
MSNIEKSYYLYPSKLIASKPELNVITVLGSCVSVCLYDTKLKIGGINHYMLPLWNGRDLPSPKYGNIAIEKLIARMESLGAVRQNIIAKVFGGGDVIKVENKMFNIGMRNIEIARKILSEAEIKILKESTGTNQGRKIMFNTYTGNVRMKFIQKTQDNNDESPKCLT